MSSRLPNITSFEPVGSTVYHYGYKCEVKEGGEVWADIPKELYALELSVGRIREESKKTPEPVIEDSKQPVVVVEEIATSVEQPVIEIAVEQPAVVEDTVKVEVAPVKIDGRSKAARQNKH